LHPNVVLLSAAEVGYGDSYGDASTRHIPLLINNPADPNGPLIPELDANGTPLFRRVVADGLPFFENFYAGGVRSIRGFEDNTLGPVFFSEFNPNFRQPLGGALKTTGTLELIFPNLLDTSTARVSTFMDFGNVFASTSDFSASEFRASVGIALQWQAPIGPIILNLSTPVKQKDGDEVERLQFTFGTQF